MRCRLLVLAGVVVAWAVLWGPRPTPAQTSSDDPKPRTTLLDRLDGLGRAIFGGPADEEKKEAKPPRPKPTTRRPKSERTAPETASPPARTARAADTEAERSQPVVVKTPQRTDGDSGSPNGSQVRSLLRADSGTEPPAVARRAAPIEDRGSETPGLAPLHERLSGFRQSVFSTSPTPGPGPDVPDRDSPQSAGSAAPPRTTITPAVPSAASNPLGVARPGGGSVASSPGPGPSRAMGPQTSPGSPWSSANAATNPEKTAQPGRVSKSADAQGVLFARQGPQLLVETVGPRRILVGKESTYEITVRNAGEVAAEEVVVTVALPEWADVMGAEASAGATTSAKAAEQAGPFRWRVGRLEPKAKERLTLRVVPRQSRPFDLGVKWDYTPAASQAQIEVQEPKLAIAFQGPRDVMFGKPELYKLEVSNTGNGDAENVVLALSPTAPGEKPATATHQLGTVAAGQTKTIDVELTARQTGNLTIHIEARGDGGIRAQRVEQIVVRRALLKVAVEAPKVQFVGTEATYRIRLANAGSAPALHPVVTATLPPATKYLASPQSPRVSADGGKVVWTLEDLAPGAEAVCVMTCSVTTPGTNRLDVQCSADADLTATASAVTQAEAIASLALTVDDPAGPVALESDAAYQVHIQNRGTASAESVEVLVYFSTGFEPKSAEGGKYQISPGQVVFEPIAHLAAGQNAVFKIKAKAEMPGNHVYRVEVRSEPSGTRVVREGTTRFYSGDGTGPDRALAKPSGRGPSLSDGIRTADRREPAPSSPDAPAPTPAPPKQPSPAGQSNSQGSSSPFPWRSGGSR
jgi:uncharacterized repeat protein (TIGR01451 family)